jgi:hypothetical protein
VLFLAAPAAADIMSRRFFGRGFPSPAHPLASRRGYPRAFKHTGRVEANTRLRALLQSSELFSVLSDSGLISRSNTLTFLCSYSAFEDADKKEALENAILKSAVASFASELDAERTEHRGSTTQKRGA